MLESFGSIAENIGDRFKLTGSPEERQRQQHGVERKRLSEIRQASKLAPWFPNVRRKPRDRSFGAWLQRRQWKAAHPRHWIEIALIEHLLKLPAETEFNQSEFAAGLNNRRGPVNVRTIQRHIRNLEGLHCLERTNQHPGRSNGVGLKLNHLALAGRLRLLGKNTTLPPITPLNRNPASGSASGPTGQSLQQAKRPSIREVHDYLMRAKQATPRKCVRGLYGAVRNAAHARGCTYPVSQIQVQVLDEAATRFGKHHAREAWTSNVAMRLLCDPKPPPTTWPEIRRYQYQAQEWTPRFLEERRQRELDREEKLRQESVQHTRELAHREAQKRLCEAEQRARVAAAQRARDETGEGIPEQLRLPLLDSYSPARPGGREQIAMSVRLFRQHADDPGHVVELTQAAIEAAKKAQQRAREARAQRERDENGEGIPEPLRALLLEVYSPDDPNDQDKIATFARLFRRHVGQSALVLESLFTKFKQAMKRQRR